MNLVIHCIQASQLNNRLAQILRNLVHNPLTHYKIALSVPDAR